MNTQTRKAAPLRPPDLSREAEFERAAAAGRLGDDELWAAAVATDAPLQAAHDRLDRHLDQATPDRETRQRLQAELEAARQAWNEATETWRRSAQSTTTARHDWLQLQAIRALAPRCALCDRAAGPVYFELGRAERPPALCLACFDTWFCEYEEDSSGRRPPSHWVQLIAQEARDQETGRRQQPDQAQLRVLGPDEDPAAPAPARPCWHCGGDVDDLGDLENLYVGREGRSRAAQGAAGAPPPHVVLKVAALVPMAIWPEIGEVCLVCADQELELFDRWAEIERDLCDPARRRHERGLRRFVEYGSR
jgi:hypothetical protein